MAYLQTYNYAIYLATGYAVLFLVMEVESFFRKHCN